MKEKFQLYTKALGVFFIASTATYAAMMVGFAIAFILGLEFEGITFGMFVKMAWRGLVTLVLTSAGPLAVGYYLTLSDNFFVNQCYPAEDKVPALKP